MVLSSSTRIAPIDISATNIRGLGAVRLVESLLPSLERIGGDDIGRVWLPDGGPLADYGAGRLRIAIAFTGTFCRTPSRGSSNARS